MRLAILFILSCISVATACAAEIQNHRNSENEIKTEVKAVEDSDVRVISSAVIWATNNVKISELSKYDAKFLNDCSLAYRIGLHYTEPDLNAVDSIAQMNSLVLYRSALAQNSSVNTDLANVVFNSKDYFQYMEQVIFQISKCEDVLSKVASSVDDSLLAVAGAE